MCDLALKALGEVRSGGLRGTFDLENELHSAAAEACRTVLESVLDPDRIQVAGDHAMAGEHDAGKRERTVKLLSGDIRVMRSCYYDRKAKSCRYPFDEALGLINGSTPALVAKALRMAAKDPYAEAADSFEANIRRRMTPDILITYPSALGAKASEFLSMGGTPDKRTPDCVCVLGDGTGLPMRRGELKGVKGRHKDGKAKTREIKVGAIFTTAPKPGSDERPVRDPDTTTYVATSERKEAFAKILRGEYDRRFPSAPKVTLFIGDGAPWLWGIRRVHFPFAVEILDFYHATEHLEGILKLLSYPEKTSGNLFRKWRRWLREGKVEKLIAEATELLGSRKGAAEAVAYFSNNKSRMKYDEYRAKGWFIGSGVVESACKTVVGARFKQSGMFWSKKGLDSLLPFRVALKSGRYDELWKHLIKDTPQLVIA
jgi:hypothetical protein